jgi:hypothetical protein
MSFLEEEMHIGKSHMTWQIHVSMQPTDRSDMARPKTIDNRLMFTLNSYNFSKKPRIDYLECIFVISIKFYVDIDSQNIG